ncbi:MAG: hemerythrin domain-containing protein [Planctomycetes bacterium]|nr:hemerythrin domain-containing protein [Planctomycetota bacterium]
MLTTSLREQHVGLASQLGAIDQAIKAGKPGTDLRTMLIEFGGKLTVHLAAEDRMVYPQLQSSQDAAIAAMAKRFASEMGGLGAAFKAFNHTYNAGAAIDADRAGFTRAFHGIVSAIVARVKAEENELYVAVDRLGKA